MLLPDPQLLEDSHPATTAYRSLAAILDAIDALVYVSDMQTYEILFINQYGKNTWGDARGKQCWAVLQSGQSGPCAFCTNPQLVDAAGQPTGVLVWEFQNTVNGHWYQCRDQAIPWIDGRLVRIEIATDITDLKNNVQALKAATRLAEERSRTDELTGIKNRRAVMDEARMLFNLARRYHTDLVVAMLDMDHFKQVNDRHGHAQGDQVLIATARTIQGNIREVDVLGRIGGEELVLVLPGMSVDNAVDAMERLRNAIAAQEFQGSTGPFHVSCSFGVAARTTIHSDFEDTLAQADKALYQAKATGRNRVVAL